MSSSDALAQLRQELAGRWHRELAGERKRLAERLRERVPRVIEQLLDELDGQPPGDPVDALLTEPLAAWAASDRALGGIFHAARAMDRCSSQGAVLEALLAAAARVADRCAVFLLRPEGVEVWGSQGFGQGAGDLLSGRELGWSAAGLDRLATGRSVVKLDAHAAGELARELGFEAPLESVLVPLVLRDHLAAALYADRIGTEPPIALEALQLLVLLAQQRIELQALSDRRETPTLWLEEESTESGLPLWNAVAVAEAGGGASWAASEAAEVGAGVEVETASTAQGLEASVLEVVAEREPAPVEARVDEEFQPAVEEESTGSWFAAEGVEEAPGPPSEAVGSGPFESGPDWASGSSVAWETEPEPAFAPLEDAAGGDLLTVEGAAGAREALPAAEDFAEAALPQIAEITAPLPSSLQVGEGPEEVSATPLVFEPAPQRFPPPVSPPPGPPSSTPVTRDLPAFGPVLEAEPPSLAPPPPPPSELETRALRVEENLLQPPPAPSALSEDATVLVQRARTAGAPEVSEDATVLVRRTVPLSEPSVAEDPTRLVSRPGAAPAGPAAGSSSSPPALEEETTQSRPGRGADSLEQTQTRRGAGTTEVAPPPDVEGPGLAFRPGGFQRPTGGDPLHEEARRLARLLISEIKLYNEDEVEEGRRNRDLYHRLRDEIDRSRQIYEERVHESVRATADYFQQELVRSLAGGDPRALGV